MSADDLGAILDTTTDREGDHFEVRERFVYECLAFINDFGVWEYGAELVPYYTWCEAHGLIEGSDDDWSLTSEGEQTLIDMRVIFAA